MLKKLSDYVHKNILENYSQMKGSDITVDDAAFLTFLIYLEKFLLFFFAVFSTISITLLFKKEIIPLLW